MKEPDPSFTYNGFKLFTVDDAAKNIGKPIILYCREYKDTWPKKSDWTNKPDPTYIKYKFTPSGNGIKETKIIENWLKTQKPKITKKTHFYLEGSLYLNKNLISDNIQVDSNKGKLISPNFMNTETFIKV
jgi:hypothetical protein